MEGSNKSNLLWSTDLDHVIKQFHGQIRDIRASKSKALHGPASDLEKQKAYKSTRVPRRPNFKPLREYILSFLENFFERTEDHSHAYIQPLTNRIK